MKLKNPTFYITLLIAFGSVFAFGNLNCFAEDETPNPIIKFFKDINYSSQIALEYDDNIFLAEDNEDADWRQIYTQGLFYRNSKDDHYFQWRYTGRYAYYNEEATDILGHTAQALYSYRPFAFLPRDFPLRNSSASSPDVKTWTGVTCPPRSGQFQCGKR